MMQQATPTSDPISVKDFGAIADGTLHPVSEWIGADARYPTLADLQVDYPHVIATTQSIDWAAIQAAINAVQAAGGGEVRIPAGTYVTNDVIKVYGSFGYRSIRIMGDDAEVQSTHVGAAIEFDPHDSAYGGPAPAPQVKQRSELDGVTFKGPGRDTAGTYGISIVNGATVMVRHCKVRSYERGISCVGALILRFFEVEMYANGYGFYLTRNASFAPNDIHFQSCFIFENYRVGYADNFGYGAITMNECECEGQNAGGNNADGRTILEFANAGKVNLIGCHFEANPGQKHIVFTGAAAYSALNIIGGEYIPGDVVPHVVEMEGLGSLFVAGVRITNNVAGQQQIYLGANNSAIVHGDTAGYIGGPGLANLTIMKNGKIATGVTYTPANAGMRSKGTAGIAHDFEGQIRFVDSSNSRVGYFQVALGGACAIANDQDGQSVAFSTKVSGVSGARLYICRGGALAIEPGGDGNTNIGSGALRFQNIFATNGTISTSDEREKQQIDDIPDEWLDAWGEVAWQQFKFRDAVAEKGTTGARWHTGLVAQAVQAAFAAHNIDASEIGLLCHDQWDGTPPQPQVLDPDGNEVSPAEPAREGGDRYGLRYEECFAIEAAYQRRRMAAIEARLAALESRPSV